MRKQGRAIGLFAAAAMMGAPAPSGAMSLGEALGNMSRDFGSVVDRVAGRDDDPDQSASDGLTNAGGFGTEGYDNSSLGPGHMMLFGSLTEDTVNHSPVPVLSIPIH